MKITRIFTNDGFNGFTQHQNNKKINYIICDIITGMCVVYFHNGSSYNLNLGCELYNTQYGLPVSTDGTMIFMSTWEKDLIAYEISTGAELWRFKQKKIRSIFVFSNYIIAHKSDSSIYKINIKDGTEIAHITENNMRYIFDLNDGNILVDAIKGKVSVLNTKEMNVIKTYKKSITNPNNYIMYGIKNAKIEDTKLILECEEVHPDDMNKVLLNKEYRKAIERVIDENYTN